MLDSNVMIISIIGIVTVLLGPLITCIRITITTTTTNTIILMCVSLGHVV